MDPSRCGRDHSVKGGAGIVRCQMGRWLAEPRSERPPFPSPWTHPTPLALSLCLRHPTSGQAARTPPHTYPPTHPHYPHTPAPAPPPQVNEWRRSYSTPPPPIEKTSLYWPGNLNQYAHIPESDLPLSECLQDTVERTLPYW
jgi:hypothetical protein